MSETQLPSDADLPENEPDPTEVNVAQAYEGAEEKGAPGGDPSQGDEPTGTPPSLTAFASPMRLGSLALNWAEDEHLHRSRSWYRDCLLFVHDAFNAPAYYARAEWAYYGADFKHTSWPPPPAVPVWWTNGTYGHVALSAGHGYCWSTDFLRYGYVDKVRIASITSGWGQHYRGWTEDINRTRVYHSSWWTLDVSNAAHAAAHRLKIPNGDKLKAAVAAEVGKGRMNMRGDTLGVGFREQYTHVQRRYLTVSGIPITGTSANGIPGLGSLTWLGERHGFYVH